MPAPIGRPREFLTPEERRRLVLAYQADISLNSLSKRFGRSPTFLKKILKEEGCLIKER